jgi:hypothetical protein
VLPLIAQLHCSIEMVAVAQEGPSTGRPAQIEHLIDFQDALTGDPLTPSDVAALEVTARAGDSPLPVAATERSPDGTTLRRVWVSPTEAANYSVRVESGDSRRYFGCEQSFVVTGSPARQVRVLLVPRMRDVSVDVMIRRNETERSLPPEGIRAIELRPAARHEREIEVHAGSCSGEHPNGGSFWCVQSLALSQGTHNLAVMVPGYGISNLRFDERSTERTVALHAHYEGHILPSTTLRAGVATAVTQGHGVGATFAMEVQPGSSLHGQTCPAADTCIRPLVHTAFSAIPYARNLQLLGPGTRTVADGEVNGWLYMFEVGAGVAVSPGGTGDALRATLLVSGVLASRDTENSPVTHTPVAYAGTRLGLSSDLFLTWRFLGPVGLWGGGRFQWFPGFGSAGRQFTFLGEAPVASTTAPLVQLVLQLGLGVEL